MQATVAGHMQVESGVDYVKVVQKNITKFEFCAACQGHSVGMSVYFHTGLSIKPKQNTAGFSDYKMCIPAGLPRRLH